MPQVPRIERQVATSPIQGGTLSQPPAGAFNGLQQTMGTTEKLAVDIFTEEKRKADQIAVLDADLSTSQIETSLLYDPQAGALMTEGKNAFGVYDSVKDSWQKHIQETEKKLTNDNQRMAYKNLVSGRWSNIDRQLQRHIGTETRKYDDQTSTAWLANEQSRVSKNYNEPGIVASSLGIQRAVIADYAKRNGLPAKYVEQKTAEATSTTHKTVLEQMMADGNDLGAKEYYQANSAEILDDADIKKGIAESSLRGESQKVSDGIVAGTKTLSEALTQARAIDESEVRDEVTKRVKQHYADLDAAEKDDLERNYMGAVNLMESNSGRNPRNIIPSNIWSKLTLPQREALERRSEDTQKNNDKVWLDYLGLDSTAISNLTRGEFETKYWSKFDKEHRNRAETLWNAAQEKTGKDKADKFTTLIAPTSVSESTWVGLGLGKPADNAEAFSQFEHEAQKQVNLFEATVLGGKRKASPEEIEKIVNDIAVKNIKVDVDLSYWPTGTTTIPLGQRKPNQQIEGFQVRKAVRTGTYQGRKVVEYSDGSVEYGN